ncbi:GDP-mannose mannosyl hydrolase [Hydrogenovibrio marinus]|uniref:GDP-mannose mannosyl hydrolase n=1 Tax=Hydrogenovibrio marinus TaxID=28885 RepID=A0A067A328_HYDMR|nr:GDP-mannose mannosyl hydrolase [Hydrogenovibrio marinus]KDN96740.1 GDP-mannose mannosyl hydrolase [Hydrogenovibrio marinus]BBN58986.1 GDP-mannose mannosyl hydrolase [Hydrogenovibrio marinus]
MLSLKAFAGLIENAPLVSIDLLVKTDSRFLLGKRINKPAKGFWFVPGGRVYKDETIAMAIRRISCKEIGKELFLDEFDFFGVFEHFYSDSFVSEDVSTHYIVLAYKIKLDVLPQSIPMSEHDEFKLFSRSEIFQHESVHEYTKQYFTAKV